MATKRTILPTITSEDISRDPDQASYKINMNFRELSRRIKELEDRITNP